MSWAVFAIIHKIQVIYRYADFFFPVEIQMAISLT